MNAEPQFWFDPLSRASKGMVKQILSAIETFVPPPELRFYVGNLYLSDRGFDFLLEACESDQLPNGKDVGRSIKATLTVMLRSPEMLLSLRDLIAQGDADAALHLHCHLIRHEIVRKN